MTHCHHCLLFKHKEEGDGSNYHHLLCYNKTIEEEDDTMPLSFYFQTQKRK
jgi:hypothetical protein